VALYLVTDSTIGKPDGTLGVLPLLSPSVFLVVFRESVATISWTFFYPVPGHEQQNGHWAANTKIKTGSTQATRKSNQTKTKGKR
jgi:hypothetical protein